MMEKKSILFIVFLLAILALDGRQVLFCSEEIINVEDFIDENVRDPFNPVLPQKDIEKEMVYKPSEVNPSEKISSFSVQGLIWGGDRPQAIINDKVLNVGDEIEGVKIVEITKEGVKISYQDEIFLIAPQMAKDTSKKQIGIGR